MATTGPSTPDGTPRKQEGGGVGRSFSTPVNPRGYAARTQGNTTRTAAIGEAAGIETLFSHSNGKVFKFNCASAGGPHPGTLSGSLLASGPLEVYRVPGSVSFLHSGTLLHAILPRTNCWCLDNISKFAMRVLTDTYYRIELPAETEEELAQVEEFKATLQKVLFYERTACPFARTFDVPLPEEEQVKKKKRRNTTHGPAKKWRQDRAYSWRPEDGGEPPHLSTSEGEESASVSEEEVEESTRPGGEVGRMLEEDVKTELEDRPQAVTKLTPSRPSVRDRVKGLTMRSVTAPPQMDLHSPTPSRLRNNVLVDSKPNPPTMDPPELRTFQAIPTDMPPELRTFQAIPTDMPPSPPDSSAGFEYSEHATPTKDPGLNRTGSPLHNPRLRQRREETASSPDTPLEPDLQPEADWQGDQARNTDEHSIAAGPQSTELFVNLDNVDSPAPLPGQAINPTIAEDDAEDDAEEPLDRVASLPSTPHIFDATPDVPNQTSQPTSTSPASTTPDPDPFAQIQARIQARRSIGGTTTSGFVPHPRQTSTSTQGASPPTVRKPSITSTKTLSHKSSSMSRQSSQQQQYLATALVKKACAVFLGPPAHLVVLMLRIAARFAKGVFPKSLLYESPRGERRRVPGSYILESDDDCGLSDNDDDEEILDEEELEDDFGVPIDSPVRLSLAVGLRERLKLDVD